MFKRKGKPGPIAKARRFLANREDKLELFSGLFSQNPILMLGVAVAPAVVATQSLQAGVMLSIGYFVMVVPTVFLASTLGKRLGSVMRTIASVLVASLLFLPMSLYMERNDIPVSTTVGIYLPILIVDAIITQKTEHYIEFATIPTMLLDLLFTGLGFSVVVCAFGTLRELLAYGKIWGVTMDWIVPISGSVAMPFFGFFLVAAAAAALRFLNNSFRRWLAKSEEE